MANECEHNVEPVLKDAATTCTPIKEVSTYAVSQGSLPTIDSQNNFDNKLRKDNNNNVMTNKRQSGYLHRNHVLRNVYNKQCKPFRNYRSLPGKLDTSPAPYEGNNSNWKSLIKSYGRKIKKKSANKSINSSIKIKLSFNAEETVKPSKNKPGKKYKLEIEFKGDKNRNLLQLQNHKTTQANSKNKISSDDAYKINTKEEIMNFKQIELSKNYSVINNSSLQYKKTTTIRRSEEKTEMLDAADSAAVDFQPSLEFTSPERSPSVLNINKSSDGLLRVSQTSQLNTLQDINEVKPCKSRCKDEGVQTPFKKLEPQDDIDLLKLGLLLEILNNTEFNTYKALGIKRSNQDTTNSENERSFRAFLKELEMNDTNYDQLYDTAGDTYSRLNLTDKSDKKFDESVKKIIASMESIDLDKDNYFKYENQYGGDAGTNKESKDDKEGTLLTNNSQDKRFKKAMQSILSFIAPSASSTIKSEQLNTDEISSVYRIPTPPRVTPCKPPTLSIWSKLNPFRLCFSFGGNERAHKAIKSDDKNDMLKSIYKNEYKSAHYCNMTADECNYNASESQMRFNTEKSEMLRTFFKTDYSAVHYCSVSDQEPPDLYSFHTKANNPIKNLIDPYASEFFNPSYLSSEHSLAKYPYDTLPYVQCPGGCSLCSPELTKPDVLQSINYSNY